MEEAQEQRHICKICGKSCASGKSLGGHMRVHLAQISASKRKAAIEMNSESKLDQNGEFQLENPSRNRSDSTALNVQNIKDCHGDTYSGDGRESREYPEESWRSSNQKRGISRKPTCKVCQKRFPSLRALSGHMKFHSVKGEGPHQCSKCGKAFDSIRAMFGHMKSHSMKSSRARDSLDLRNLCPVRKKRSRVRYDLESNPLISCSNVSSFPDVKFEEEQDAAVCLMMLSKGVTESSCCSSVYCGAGSSRRSRGMSGSDGSFAFDGDKLSTSLTFKKLDCCISDSRDTFSEKNEPEFEGLECNKAPKMLEEFAAKLESSSASTKLAESEKAPIMEACIQENDSEFLKFMSCKKARISVHELEMNSPQKGASNLEISNDSDKKNQKRRIRPDFDSSGAIGSQKASCKLSSNTPSKGTNACNFSVNADCIKHNDQVEYNDNQIEQESKESGRSSAFFSSVQALCGHKKAQRFGSAGNFFDLNIPLTADEGTNGQVGLNLWRAEIGHEHEALVHTNREDSLILLKRLHIC